MNLMNLIRFIINNVKSFFMLLFIVILCNISFSVEPLHDSELKKITGFCQCLPRTIPECPGEVQPCVPGKVCYVCEIRNYGQTCQGGLNYNCVQVPQVENCGLQKQGICVGHTFYNQCENTNLNGKTCNPYHWCHN